eukprot:1458922-Pyramimonas_sp.AAC.1
MRRVDQHVVHDVNRESAHRVSVELGSAQPSAEVDESTRKRVGGGRAGGRNKKIRSGVEEEDGRERREEG